MLSLLDLDSWTHAPGLRLMDLGSWTYVPGLKRLDLRTWTYALGGRISAPPALLLASARREARLCLSSIRSVKFK